MKRLALACLVLTMLAIISPAAAMAYTAAHPYKTDLVAGPTRVDIGDVKMWNDATNIYVKFETVPGWYLFGTKVEVRGAWYLIPQADGNAIPDQFRYRAAQDLEYSYTQKIPVKWPSSNKLYIAASAEVGPRGGSVADALAHLPGVVTAQVTYPVEPRASYWDVNLTGGTPLDGFHSGWCASPHLPLDSGWTGLADVFSSYSNAVPTTSVGKVGNLDSVNWVLNQDYVGKGVYWRVVQAAIWKLLSTNIWGTEKLSQEELALVDTIVADALRNDGFVPRSGQNVAVVLAPRDAAAPWPLQPVLTVKQVPTSGTSTETAWVRGPGFPGSDWSMYSPYWRQVRPYVRTPKAPKTMRRNRYYTVYGWLKPRHKAGTYPVRIYKWKKTSSGRWKSYGYVYAKAYNYSSYTKYARKIKLTSRGKWRLRAYARADSAHLAAWSSGYDYVTVK